MAARRGAPLGPAVGHAFCCGTEYQGQASQRMAKKTRRILIVMMMRI